jgi:hypothetical protein
MTTRPDARGAIKGEPMSFNVYNGKNLNVSCYIRASGLPMQAPMILPQECGEMPKDPPGSETFYSISDNHGSSVDLAGWEAVLMPIVILTDALRREVLRRGIEHPLPEQLDQLRDVLEKLGPVISPESEQG